MIADDASGKRPIIPDGLSIEGLKVVVGKIFDDKEWNLFAAQNTGSREASGLALFLDDLDILIAQTTAELSLNLVREQSLGVKVVNFSRLGCFDGSIRSVHHNTMLIDRKNVGRQQDLRRTSKGFTTGRALFSKTIGKRKKHGTL